MGVGAAVWSGAMVPQGGGALTAMEGGGVEWTPTLVVAVIGSRAEGARSRDEPAAH